MWTVQADRRDVYVGEPAGIAPLKHVCISSVVQNQTTVNFFFVLNRELWIVFSLLLHPSITNPGDVKSIMCLMWLCSSLRGLWLWQRYLQLLFSRAERPIHGKKNTEHSAQSINYIWAWMARYLSCITYDLCERKGENGAKNICRS